MAVGLPPLVVYVLAAAVVATYTSVRPIQISLLPMLVGRAEQLTAANAVSTLLEGAGVLLGPLICGVLIGLASPAAVYLAGGAATLAAAGLTRTLTTAPMSVATGRPVPGGAVAPLLNPPLPNPPDQDPPSAVPDGSDLGGLATLRADPGRLLSVVLLATRFGVAAAMDVLLVLAAIEVLGMGAAGAGYLSAAIGLGWIVGGATTLVIVGRPRLTPLTLVGSLAWAMPVVAVAVVARAGPSLVLLVGAGVGLAVVDVAVRTVLQRLVPTNRLAVVFGIAEGASMAGAAVGALAAGILVAALGVVGAIAVAGVLLPVVARGDAGHDRSQRGGACRSRSARSRSCGACRCSPRCRHRRSRPRPPRLSRSRS